MPPPSIKIRPKSINDDWPAYVTFFNRLDFPVDIIWCDYNGRLVRYCNRLQPGGHLYQNTFVTHPWQAFNSDTHEKVRVGGQWVFRPLPWRGEQQRTMVYIDRPVLSLLKLCMRRIRELVAVDDVEELEIPRHLFEKLQKRRSLEVRDYQHPSAN